MPKIGNMPPPAPRGRAAGSARPPAMDWSEAIRLLRKHPRVDVLADSLTGLPHLRTMYSTVRAGGVSALRGLGGVVVPSRRSESGSDTGDLWLRWEPDADPTKVYRAEFIRRDQKRAEREANPV